MPLYNLCVWCTNICHLCITLIKQCFDHQSKIRSLIDTDIDIFILAEHISYTCVSHVVLEFTYYHLQRVIITTLLLPWSPLCNSGMKHRHLAKSSKLMYCYSPVWEYKHNLSHESWWWHQLSWLAGDLKVNSQRR